MESKWRLNVSTEGWADGILTKLARVVVLPRNRDWMGTAIIGGSQRTIQFNALVDNSGRMTMGQLVQTADTMSQWLAAGWIEPDHA